MARPGDEHRLADHQRVVAAHPREIDRIEIGQAVEADAEDEARTASRRAKLRSAKARRSTIGCSRREHAHEEDDRRRWPTTQASSSTVSSPNQSLRGPSSSTYSSAPRKTAMESRPTQSKFSNSDQSGLSKSISSQAATVTTMPGHDVDEEQPVPGERVGEIAADGRADGRRQRRDEADHRRRSAPMRERGKIDEGGGEHGRDHAAADEALEGAPDDHLVDRGREAAQQARGREAAGRDGEQHARATARATGSPTAGS